MSLRVQRAILLVLAATGLDVGVWGLIDPESFYQSFPGFGRHWVSVDGPYNEHLIRDVAAFYCAMAVLAIVAAVRGERALMWTAGLAWVVFSIPHLAYHAAHLDHYGTFDKWANMASLAGTLLLAALVLLPVSDRQKGES